MAQPVNLDLERLYASVELVRGAGNPDWGKLCVMSFVACLAGEPHTDRPLTASSLVGRFAITINDEMPTNRRQSLKPFAPRILGTRDGCDAQRFDLLRVAFFDEIRPAIANDFEVCGNAPAAGWRGWFLCRIQDASRAWAIILRMARALDAGIDSADAGLAAQSVATLLARCAQHAPTPHLQDVYWGRAIEVLDRLCQVGADRERPQAQPGHVAWLSDIAAQRNNRKRSGVLTAAKIGTLLS